MKNARKAAYREFLKSEFWRELSLRVRRNRGRCHRCKRKDRLQAHHKFYRDDWYETLESDLVVLCRKCHMKEHGLMWDEKIYGPPYMMCFQGRDWDFNVILYRIDSLKRKVLQGRQLRERDERFLEKALRMFPPTKKDSCMDFHVKLTREWNEKSKAGLFS